MASTIYEQKRFCEIKRCGEIEHLGNVPVMVRNAVCVSWKTAMTAILTIRRRRTATLTPTLSPATLT